MKHLEGKMSEIDIRDAFFDELYMIAKNDPKVMFLTADMGAFSLARFRKDLRSQYINVGVAEQNMVSIAAGLALGGKRVFIYTIIPFATMRCYEQIKVDLCCMNLPVTIIGVGPGLTYGSDGPTHHATQDIAIMRTLPEIIILNPSDSVIAKASARIAYGNCSPTYVRLDKGKLPLIYNEARNDYLEGITELKTGSELTIISTGTMIHEALKVSKELDRRSISTAVVDLYRIKPLNIEKLLSIIAKSKRLITVEEHNVVGGIGSLIAEVLNDRQSNIPLKRIAISDQHCFECGNREELRALYGLTAHRIIKNILEWV